MSMWVEAHTVVVAMYCFLRCVTDPFTALQDFTVMASTGRNMQLYIIATIYTFSDSFVFDYIPFPIFTHTTVMTQFLDTSFCESPVLIDI